MYDAVLEDTFAYAMQYFPLGSLAAPARPLARTEVHRALEHAARAAHALHEAGMAHGDIKPANVLLTEGSAARSRIGGRLSDLGLARFLAPGATLTSMGRASSVEYLDPDVIGGARPSRRTEIWALGATVHRALAGTGLYGELPDAQPLLAIRKVLGAAAADRPGAATATRPSSCGSASPPTTAGCRPRRPWPTAWPRCAPDVRRSGGARQVEDRHRAVVEVRDVGLPAVAAHRDARRAPCPPAPARRCPWSSC